MLKVFVGFDPREALAYRVCVTSLLAYSSLRLEVAPLLQAHLRAIGLYRRRELTRGTQVWDTISDAPVSTEFALTRFLVPHLACRAGWALYCDCDFLWRADVAELLALAEPDKAVMVVQHDHCPTETVKMEALAQLGYRRKNWSSLMLINAAHAAHRTLSLEAINGWPGRDLHGFRWLRDEEIGALPEDWNWLEGWSDPAIKPKAVHYTRGTPDLPGYEAAAHADEWRGYATAVGLVRREADVAGTQSTS